MDLNKMYQRYLEIRKLYAESDKRRFGQEWPRSEFVRAMTADVGALVKLTMGKDGLRDIDDIDIKMAHEMADCLYSIFVIAEKYDVDLDKAFMDTMDELEKRAQNMELPKSHSL
jgi:NTP pyrophosphatase (non-canonical NTP hydrolase)